MEPHQQKESKKISREEYQQYLIRSSVVVIAAAVIIIFYFCVQRFDGLGNSISSMLSILQPIIIGFVMAFLMNPIMKFFEKWMLPIFLKHTKNENKTRKHVRLWTSIIALIILLGVITLFLISVIPQVYTTADTLIKNLNTQIAGVLDWANQVTRGHFEKALMDAKTDKNIDNAIESFKEWLQGYFHLDKHDEMIQTLTSWGINVGRGFINIIIGIIVSVYVLVSKETFKGHIKKVIYGIFKPHHANIVLEIGRKTNDIFYGFIIGKIIDSIIIGIICYVGMSILQMPYVLLSSVIVGVTNVIPVFGPYIGAIPTTIIIFLTNPVQGIYFLIFIFLLQQVDGNIIGPKILGDSTGISSFWVVFAIVVGGGLFGFFGMLLGVPTVAVLYYLGGRIARYMLRRRGLPEATDDYVMLKEIDLTSHKIIEKQPEDEIKTYVFKNWKKKPKDHNKK